MIILRNINKTQTTIEADYYPEGGQAKGYVKVSLPDGEFLEVKPAPGHEHSSDPAHVMYDLLRLAKLDVMPEERTVIWY